RLAKRALGDNGALGLRFDFSGESIPVDLLPAPARRIEHGAHDESFAASRFLILCAPLSPSSHISRGARRETSALVDRPRPGGGRAQYYPLALPLKPALSDR